MDNYQTKGPRSSYFQSLGFIVGALFISACSSMKSSQPPPQATLPTGTTAETAATIDLNLCKMKVTNPPVADGRKIRRASPRACVNGVNLLVAPAPAACLSSGFGTRNKRRHQGLDYQSKPAGKVVAAADGQIINISYRKKDYGHWVIIDHGDGIYTSYAHLKNVDVSLQKGGQVQQGQLLGTMGKSGDAAHAIHLHYELRQGDYHNPKAWWGLKSIDPFALPDRC